MQAIKLPLLVHYSARIKGCKRGSIIIPENTSMFMVKIGFHLNPMAAALKHTTIHIHGGKIAFLGKATIGKGNMFKSEGYIEFGNNFYSQQDCVFWCKEKIIIGQDVLCGWNVMLRDHDGHTLYKDGIEKPEHKPISVGDHVWLCSEVNVMKGAVIQEDSVVAYKSLVTKAIGEPHALIAGIPAKTVQTNIEWSR